MFFHCSYTILKLVCLISPVFIITGIRFYILNKGMTIYFLIMPCKIPNQFLGMVLLLKLVGLYSRRN